MSGTQPDAIILKNMQGIGNQCNTILIVKQQTVYSNRRVQASRTRVFQEGYVKLLPGRKV